jgi:hypothetical protein
MSENIYMVQPETVRIDKNGNEYVEAQTLKNGFVSITSVRVYRNAAGEPFIELISR